MAAKYFDPNCIKPIYLMDDEKQAMNCGTVTGITYSSIISIFVISITTRFYFKEENNERKTRILIAGILCFILIWIFIPLMMRYSYKNLWIGYNNSNLELQKQGYDKDTIITILQSFDSNVPISFGMLSSGSAALFASSKKTPSSSS